MAQRRPKGGELTTAGRVYLQALAELRKHGQEEMRSEEPKGPCYWRLKNAGYIEWTGESVRLTAAGVAVAPEPRPIWVRVKAMGLGWVVVVDDGRIATGVLSRKELQVLERSIREALGDG